MITLDDLRNLNPCEDGFDYAKSKPSLYQAWEECENSSWMWWLLRKLKVSKEISVQYADFCAKQAAYAAAAYAAAADTAYAAAAYAAYAAAAYAAARKEQANFIRSIVTNPFKQ